MYYLWIYYVINALSANPTKWSNTLKQWAAATASWNWQKIKQMLRNTLRLNFSYLKIIHILHQRYHAKVTGHILKNKQNDKYVCIHEIIRLIIKKMKMKMKNGSYRYDINRPRSRHGRKYTKYKKCFTMMILICIKQHLKLISWKG